MPLVEAHDRQDWEVAAKLSEKRAVIKKRMRHYSTCEVCGCTILSRSRFCQAHRYSKLLKA